MFTEQDVSDLRFIKKTLLRAQENERILQGTMKELNITRPEDIQKTLVRMKKEMEQWKEDEKLYKRLGE